MGSLERCGLSMSAATVVAAVTAAASAAALINRSGLKPLTRSTRIPHRTLEEFGIGSDATIPIS